MSGKGAVSERFLEVCARIEPTEPGVCRFCLDECSPVSTCCVVCTLNPAERARRLKQRGLL
jgi:hypothetical protein